MKGHGGPSPPYTAEKRAAVLASEEENARQEAAQLETQARAAQIREFGKDSAAGVHTQTKEKVSDSRTDRYLDTTGGERERRMKLAKDPAIQAKFQPFLARGRARCHRNSQSIGAATQIYVSWILASK